MVLSSEMAAVALGLGTDIVDIERIQHAHERHGNRFLKRIYTEEEQAYCLGMKNPYPHLAARFAAKEAVSKCFGTGICGEFGWTSVSICKGSRDEPYAKLDEKGQTLLDAMGGTRVLVSLSHTSSLGHAVALVVK
ncbi:holo-ACP synthase [Rubellicoccus peritrichatus]|uniref:Holo-[acyl-carrier-protein] synthase n=1 Tax=Rubellicoccus peritrichatus TaxID=3080537 RepID=A0AAQ3LGC4_9BACT|nr:holo-ACP synthase [Puniceicoccus sp. CR14]WOO43333.1 holo-ACP synthase [Puniceicoccus sp. CR14]